ncbi:hypothetical protein KUTeg_020477 [Tegillarca granosa]|uniref:Uncharacterized protein n=1 Tax=Tegillarca granosa TaxID=220873 RepID=A0ABQ9E8I8_TEGGR|nr:hypothetical protein KUTeg_020477 [Tegillarca granosa]
MDKFKSFTGILLVTFTTITVVCNASNEVFINKESKCKTLSIDTDGTTIKWRKFTLNCKIELKKKDFWDDKICAKMSKVNLENYSSSVIFGTSFSILKKWTEYSSGDDSEVCTSSLFAYIELDLHEAYGAKFDLKVYSKKDDPVIFSSNAESEIDTAVHAAWDDCGNNCCRSDWFNNHGCCYYNMYLLLLYERTQITRTCLSSNSSNNYIPVNNTRTASVFIPSSDNTATTGWNRWILCTTSTRVCWLFFTARRIHGSSTTTWWIHCHPATTRRVHSSPTPCSFCTSRF